MRCWSTVTHVSLAHGWHKSPSHVAERDEHCCDCGGVRHRAVRSHGHDIICWSLSCYDRYQSSRVCKYATIVDSMPSRISNVTMLLKQIPEGKGFGTNLESQLTPIVCPLIAHHYPQPTDLCRRCSNRGGGGQTSTSFRVCAHLVR